MKQKQSEQNEVAFECTYTFVYIHNTIDFEKMNAQKRKKRRKEVMNLERPLVFVDCQNGHVLRFIPFSHFFLLQLEK